YELDGEIERYDTATGETRRLDIRVPDDGLNRRPARVSAAKQIEDFELSPKGERALFVARGDLFTVPVEKGSTRNLTRTSGAHDRHARWSPDGRSIAFVSDRGGEDQIHVVAQDGSGEATALTSDHQAMLYAPEWSPDGARLAYTDKSGKVYVLGVADRKRLEIADDRFGRVFDLAWAPDSQWLAFSLQDDNGTRSLWIWSAADGKARRATDELFEESTPAWDPDGDYLYFLSDREFAPQVSAIEWNYAGNRITGVFALALRKDAAHPFPPESDEVSLEAEKKEADGAKGKSDEKKKDEGKGEDAKADKKPKPVKIDFDGLADRVVRVPLDSENITGLAVIPGHLLYSTSGPFFYGRESYEKSKLRIFDRKKRESSVLVEDIAGWAVSRDGAKVLVRSGGAYQLYDAKPKATEKKTVSTADLEVDRVPAEEWREIFDEVWRRYRDFFYVANLHGYDWQAIGDRYRTLLPFVAHRSDLNYVLSEMVAELSVGHAYIEGGDFQIPERPKVGLPGARFALDRAAGRYQLAKIYRGDNEEAKYRAPLTEVGVDAREGDYVLAIDGVELTATTNPYQLLRHKTDPVTLTLNAKPSFEGARKVTYRPIDDEGGLLYLDWIAGNRKRVAEATGGRVG
ncbi:MAG: PDZ domain-containing protein, partial [Thermoanaerobaculia bacterium]|nr:PDZ domain-containing protein [Thermoanaerobaculia bacterium]